MVLSLVNSGVYLAKSAGALFFKWMEYILVFIIAQDILRNNRKAVYRVVFILLFIAFWVSLSGLSQKFLGFEFMRGKKMLEIKEGMVAITGPFKHYNNFGAYLISIFPLAFTLLIKPGMRNIWKISLFFAALLLLVCLPFTYSRGAWLGFIGEMFIFGLLTKKYPLIIPPLIILAALFLLIPALQERFLFIFQKGGDSGRFGLWKASLLMIKDNPFLGKGVGTYMDYFSKYMPNAMVQYAHNCFLQIWAETGIFSLLSFLLFLVSIFITALRFYKNTKSYLILGFIMGTAGFLIHSFFDTQLYSLQLAMLFWILLGIFNSLFYFYKIKT